MKVGPRRIERRTLAKAALSEQTGEKRSVAESLDFIKSGDLQLLEVIGVDPFGEERDVRAALAIPGLVFSEKPVKPGFKQQREEYIEDKRNAFDSWTALSGTSYEDRDSLTKLLKAAEEVFLFRALLDSDLPQPSQEAWEVIQRKVREFASKPHADLTNWLVKLLYIDPVRFKDLPHEELHQLCLQNIAKERAEYPASKDKRQIRLLHALATTRLMFPDLIDPSSLSAEERVVARDYLENQRVYAQTEGGSGFAFYFYLLSLVEIPVLRVDEKGIHLESSKGFQGKVPDLPVRLEI